MKRMVIAICFAMICGHALGAETAAARPDLPSSRRQPYKEVRTKYNQDPATKEALRQKTRREYQEIEEHRKKVNAQMEADRASGKYKIPPSLVAKGKPEQTTSTNTPAATPSSSSPVPAKSQKEAAKSK